MFLVWLFTWILSTLAVAPAVALWAWFGHHVFLTILMLVFLA